MKNWINAIFAMAILGSLAVSVFLVMSIFEEQLSSETESLSWVVDEPNKVVSEEETIVLDDRLVCMDVKFITYKRSDGLLVPTHLLKISKFEGGSTEVDTVKLGSLSEDMILAFNGVNKYPRGLTPISNWELK